MKTQRQRGSGDRRPAPDSNGRPASANGDISSGAGSNGEQAQDGPVQSFAPQLPKRRPQRESGTTTVADTAEPVGNGAGSSVAVSAPVDAPGKGRRPGTKEQSLPATPDARALTSEPRPETASGIIGRAWNFMMTYENAIYLAIFILAFVSRFYDLGSRALHHDESLHAVYSRNLYSGAGYQHDPMMHGPLQFHMIALMFWLFGTSDATVRFASATCGLIVVISPFFLRRQMGRLPALTAAVLFLFSPSVLYFSRMAREDAIFSGMETIMIVGLWRFLSTRRPGDFYIFCAGLALMFTIKETTYLTLAVLGVLFMFLFAYQAGYAILGALFGYLATLGGVVLYISSQMKAGKIPKLPDIPGTNPDYATITQFAGGFLTHPEVASVIVITLVFVVVLGVLFRVGRRTYVRAPGAAAAERRRSVPSRKAALANGVEGPATMAASEASTNGHEPNGVAHPSVAEVAETPLNGSAATDPVIAAPNAPEPEVTPLWNPKALSPKKRSLFAHYEQGSLPHLVGGLLARPSVLLIGFTIFAVIFVTLYSVFFTDVPRGIASGLFASLGYWIAQQAVARGGQPWFYYFLLVPLYEPIAVFFSAAAAIFFSWRGLRWLRRHHVFFSGTWWRWLLRMDRDDPEQADRPHLGVFNTDRPVPFAHVSSFLPLFTGWWLLGALVIYSWAGEKMPWLMMHITRPAIYMASFFLGALALSLITARRKRLANAGLLDDSQSYSSGMQPRRQMAAGAHFTLSGVRSYAQRAGLLPRQPAFEGGPAGDAAFSMGRGGPAAGAMRRQGGKVLPTMPVFSVQEPPWVSWNKPGSVFPFASYVSIFMVLALGWGMSMSQQNYDVASRAGNLNNWGWTWFFPAAILVVTVSYAIWLGVGRALRYSLVGLFSLMLLYQFHSGFTLAYRQPDGAQELAVYVQTSPDVTRVMKELNAFSQFTTGGKDVKVIYDSEVSWPFEWYLGDYPNKQFIGGSRADPGPDVKVMFLGYQTGSNNYHDLSDSASDDAATKAWKAKMRQDWTVQRYALRWWFPEEWYKNEFLPHQFATDANGQIITDPATGEQKQASALSQTGDALHTIFNTITVPDNQSKLWNYLMYKEPPKPLGSTDFMVFIRKDSAQLWHYLQYQPIPSTDVP
jgi:predicted membrane-bound mannosyltransferase